MPKLTIFSLARENMKRRIFRTMLVIVTVGLSTGTLFTTTMLLRGVETGIRQGTSSLGADILVVPRDSEVNVQALMSGEASGMLMGGLTATTFLKRDIVSEIAKINGIVATTPQLYITTWAEGGHCRVNNAQIIGFDPKTDFIIKPLLENKLIWPISADEIIVGNNMTPPLADGEKVSPWPIYGYPFSIVGRLKKTSTSMDYAMFMTFDGIELMAREATKYISAETSPEIIERLKTIKRDNISSILVKIDPLTTNLTGIKLGIAMVIPDAMVISTAEMITTLSRQLFSTLQGLLVSGLALWVMSIIVVGAIFSMIINERRREIGILRAIGATSFSVFKLTLYESSMLTGLGGAIGVTLGAVIVYYFNSMIRSTMRMPYVWPRADEISILFIICLFAGVIAGVLGALYPAVRISKMEPLDVIRLGE